MTEITITRMVGVQILTHTNACLDAVTLQENNLQRMMAGVSIFVFQKKDGIQRTAIGTLNPAFIPKEKSEETNKYHTPSPLNQTFFDIATNNFRSYNMENIVALIDL